MPSELTIRPATVEDADALATLFLAAREAAFPAIPRTVHPPEDVRRWMLGRMESLDCEAWLAEEGADPVALLLLEGPWVHSLYVDAERTGEGIGSLLLEVAKQSRPRRLGLWVFETNERARRFYERHGFVEIRRTDGADNEEGEPDVEMVWPDPASLRGLRARIDDLDDQLAALLAERAQATAMVQRVKPVPGHAGRDAEREDEIVRRMARLAPALGEERLRRIMHAVITESLDAAPDGQPADGSTDRPTDGPTRGPTGGPSGARSEGSD